MASRAVINVCFHGVGTTQRQMEPGEDHYWVSVDQFHRVLDEIMTWPSVHISFDDGNASDVAVALPALIQRGLTADFFVLAGRLGHSGSLDRDDLGELRHHQMTVGSHGMRHRSWRHMAASETEEEFREARQLIADASGQPVEKAACPLGLYDRRVLAGLRDQGYTGVFTSDRRVANADAWLQPRFSVRRDDTPETVRAIMLEPSSLRTRARGAVVGAVKRWR